MQNNNKRLPDAAYVALTALKNQAKAVAANNFEGDKEALAAAQSDMADVESWTKAIYRKLMTNKDDETIETIDNDWLETQFQ